MDAMVLEMHVSRFKRLSVEQIIMYFGGVELSILYCRVYPFLRSLHFTREVWVLITRIEISNFRSLRHIDLDCGDVMSPGARALLAILGRNGGGKSSILY